MISLFISRIHDPPGYVQGPLNISLLSKSSLTVSSLSPEVREKRKERKEKSQITFLSFGPTSVTFYTTNAFTLNRSCVDKGNWNINHASGSNWTHNAYGNGSIRFMMKVCLAHCCVFVGKEDEGGQMPLTTFQG